MVSPMMENKAQAAPGQDPIMARTEVPRRDSSVAAEPMGLDGQHGLAWLSWGEVGSGLWAACVSSVLCRIGSPWLG